jgi:hypothetical protein
MNRFKIFSLLTLIILSITFYSVAHSADTIKGKVVSINDLVVSKESSPDKAAAAQQYKANQPLGFLSNGKLYFVVNTGGGYAGRDLAKMATGSEVTINGSMKISNGMNYIILK